MTKSYAGAPHGTVFHIMRHSDGTLEAISPLPKRHTFSARYITDGGNAALRDHRAHLKSGDTEAAEKINTEHMFEREGMDLLFHFRDDPETVRYPYGDVKYRFVGFETRIDGEGNQVPDTSALIYEMVEED